MSKPAKPPLPETEEGMRKYEAEKRKQGLILAPWGAWIPAKEWRDHMTYLRNRNQEWA